MNKQEMPEITALLQQWGDGESASLDRLLELTYDELKRAAAKYLSRESSSHTLQPTALLHEVYMRLRQTRNMRFPDRVHFFGFASQTMRRILVEHARAKLAQKRGGDQKVLHLSDGDALAAPAEIDPSEVLALDAALDRLAKADARRCEIVTLWYFGGLDANEIGKLFERSPITIRRELRTAHLWLQRAINAQVAQV